MSCQHGHIMTFRFEDGSVAMWACVECRRKFEPVRKWRGLTGEEAAAMTGLIARGGESMESLIKTARQYADDAVNAAEE